MRTSLTLPDDLARAVEAYRERMARETPWLAPAMADVLRVLIAQGLAVSDARVALSAAEHDLAFLQGAVIHDGPGRWTVDSGRTLGRVRAAVAALGGPVMVPGVDDDA